MKITLDYSLKLNPTLNPDLFIPDPKQVLEKIGQTPISDWLNFISNDYEIQKVKNLILIPCSFYKPYNPPRDEFYRRIADLRKGRVGSKFIAVSVPLALEPEEFWNFQWRGFNLIYDCPFFPWVEKYGYTWDQEIVQKVLSKLESVINNFFERNKKKCGRVIAFFIPGSNELKLVEKHIDFVIPCKEPDVEISYNNNTSEIYCHPEVWKEFESFLREIK